MTVTLRLKDKHDVTVTGESLDWESDYTFALDFNPLGSTSPVEFEKAEWELQPPPYELPTGIGAVIKHSNGNIYVRTAIDNWTNSVSNWNGIVDGSFTTAIDMGHIKTISEGVIL